MPVGPVCAISVIGMINKTGGTEAVSEDASIHVIAAMNSRARGALGGARARTVPVSPRDGSRGLSARKARRGAVTDDITRGVGSCL